MKGVSVIVCCYNSKTLLPPTLAHLAKQNVPENVPWEIIIVDNASTDGTGSYAGYEWNKNGADFSFRVVYEGEPGLINARIRGTGEALYEYLVFCDDDNWLCDDYIANAFRILSGNDRVGACGGRGSAVYETGSRPEWLTDAVQNAGYATGPQGDKAEGPVGDNTFFIYGAGMVIRKSVVKEIYEAFNHTNMLLSGRKGNSLSAGDDVAICFFLLMKGYQLWYSDRLKFSHFLTSRRLKREYALKMFNGFGLAAAHIKLYHSFLPGTGKIKRFVYSFWITQLFLQLYLVCADYLFFPDKDAKPFVIKRQVSTLKEILKGRKDLRQKRQILRKCYAG